MVKKDKCFECEKTLKSFDYFTLARINKTLDNSTIKHFCNKDCLKKHVNEESNLE